MQKVILQPCSSNSAKKHFNNTIEQAVSITRIEKYLLHESVTILKEIAVNNKIRVWGVTPGKKRQNEAKWARIEVGDIALFAANKRIFASAVVTHKIHNRELSIALWGETSEDETWEYVFFVDELKSQDINYEDFNLIVGYAQNNNIQGFNVLDNEKSQKILEHFDMYSMTYQKDIEEEEYIQTVNESETEWGKDMDQLILSTRRVEQSYLRNYLFGQNKVARCSICNKKFPIDLLVAAHIKKRSHCTHVEKLDYKNNVVPMCKLGCDDIFEKGYITINDGTILRNALKIVTEDLDNYICKIENSKYLKYSDQNKKYFDWHRKYHLA